MHSCRDVVVASAIFGEMFVFSCAPAWSAWAIPFVSLSPCRIIAS